MSVRNETGRYLGFDIGTTNMKVLSVDQSGKISTVKTERTPTYSDQRGVHRFDLQKIIDFTRTTLTHTAESGQRIEGIGFSSIGESVVPLDEAGSPLADPILWYDGVTRKTAEELSHESRLRDYYSRGVRSSYTMGVYKMYYMLTTVIEQANVSVWLPLSSYLPFVLGGDMLWDYSQACRTLLLDIHKQAWDQDTIQHIGLIGGLPGPGPMGTPVGSTEAGIPLFVGGHDHIVGLNGIRELFGQDIIYYSLGSASLIGGIVSATADRMKEHMRRNPMLTVGRVRAGSEYPAELPGRYAGKLIESVARLIGSSDPQEFLSQANESLQTYTPSRDALFMVEGDVFVGEQSNGFSVHEVPIDISPIELIHSVYTYLSAATAMAVDSLSPLFERPRLLVGGGPTNNRVLMQYMANGLQKDLSLLPEAELSALGAAILAVVGCKDRETLENCRGRLEPTIVQPSNQIGPNYDQIDAYRRRIERLAGNVFASR